MEFILLNGGGAILPFTNFYDRQEAVPFYTMNAVSYASIMVQFLAGELRFLFRY